MHILVTGGAGFIGSHLCDYLVNQNKKVICLDNLKSGSTSNIDHLLNNKNFKFIQHDITELFKIEEPVAEIYHLASLASPLHYQQNPLETALANTLGTNNLIKLALEKGAKFLYASTSEVYGDPEVHPQHEEYSGNVSCIGPRACYDESKRFGETLIVSYMQQHSLNGKIVRIFNTYGPKLKVDDGRVISNFIVQALKNEPLTVYGKGDQTRSFCYISDLIVGLVKMMKSNHHGPINLGNPNEHAILDIAEKIKKLSNSKSEITFKPLPINDPYKRKPDITKARTLLEWEPKIDLEEGLIKTLEWFNINL